MDSVSQPGKRGRGEPWALGSVLGYASANIFDRLAVVHADPLVGPFLRGLPSLLLGIILVWRNKTLDQLRPATKSYVGRRAVLSFVVAGVLSTLGLFLYYFAIQLGGVTITVPAIETWVIWGTVAAWVMLKERLRGYLLGGWGLIGLGMLALIYGQLRGRPISPHWYWALPLALTAAVTYGVSGVLWRDGQLRGAHQSTAILLQFITSEAVAILGLAVTGRLGLLASSSWRTLGALTASGVLSGVVAIYCMFTALRLMEVHRVNAFSSLTPILAVVFAHFLLREYLSAPILAGVVLISAGVALTQILAGKNGDTARWLRLGRRLIRIGRHP